MCKFDIYSFCKKAEKNDYRPQLTGIHYANGYAEASDSHILAVVPAYYPEADENGIITRKGERIADKKYPKCDGVYRDPEQLEGVAISKDAVRAAAKEARSLYHRRTMLGYAIITTETGTAYYSLDALEKFCALMDYIGADKMYLDATRPGYTAAFAYGGDYNKAKGWGAIMPYNVKNATNCIRINAD